MSSERAYYIPLLTLTYSANFYIGVSVIVANIYFFVYLFITTSKTIYMHNLYEQLLLWSQLCPSDSNYRLIKMYEKGVSFVQTNLASW